jgi:proteasome lid subunit RPN8/RPN11
MCAVRAESEYGCWSVEGHAARIEYIPAVAEEICATTVEGLSRLRRGGVEVGGVLFGIRHGDLVRVLAFRPTACEHAAGPSFVLSEKDRRALENLLESAKRDRTLRGLEPVGWYHSHTRSEIFLSEEDLEIHDRYFPESGQIAMVIQPAQFGPARVGFFFREPDGTVQAERSYLEFSVKPRARRKPRPELQPVPPSAPARSGGNGGARTAEAADRYTEPVQPGPAPAPPSFSLIEPRVSHKRFWLVSALCLALVGLGVGAGAYWFRTPAQPLAMRVMDIDGQLLIEWDRTAGPIQEASGATVEIMDGIERTKVEMDGERLREGSITYARRSDRVDVRFRVNRPGSQPVEEFIRFLGQPVPGKPSPEELETIRQRDDLQQEVEKMRAELRTKNAQLRRLQQPQQSKTGLPKN